MIGAGIPTQRYAGKVTEAPTWENHGVGEVYVPALSRRLPLALTAQQRESLQLARGDVVGVEVRFRVLRGRDVEYVVASIARADPDDPILRRPLGSIDEDIFAAGDQDRPRPPRPAPEPSEDPLTATLWHSTTGESANVKMGYSWTTLYLGCFGGIPLFLRGLYLPGAIMGVFTITYVLMLMSSYYVDVPGEEIFLFFGREIKATGMLIMWLYFLLVELFFSACFGAYANFWFARRLINKGYRLVEKTEEETAESFANFASFPRASVVFRPPPPAIADQSVAQPMLVAAPAPEVEATWQAEPDPEIPASTRPEPRRGSMPRRSTPAQINPDLFHEVRYRPVLRRIAADFIETEGPITFKRLSTLVAREHGIKKVGKNISSTIWASVNELRPRTHTVDGDELFWPAGATPEAVIAFRGLTVAGREREWDEVPLPERLGLVHKVKSGGQADVARAVAAALGYRRLTEAFRSEVSKLAAME